MASVVFFDNVRAPVDVTVLKVDAPSLVKSILPPIINVPVWVMTPFTVAVRLPSIVEAPNCRAVVPLSIVTWPVVPFVVNVTTPVIAFVVVPSVIA